MKDCLLEYDGYLLFLQFLEEIILWEQLWFDLEEARDNFQ